MKKIHLQTEKKMVYGIRSLKNGTGSVLIGASIVLLSAAMPTISANETFLKLRKILVLWLRLLPRLKQVKHKTKAPFLNKRMQTLPLTLKKEAPRN